MNNYFSQAEQRRAAAHKYRIECANARGEVECSECEALVPETRGNRNAQELEREGVRKNKGPVCNACQASWRYSHHQDSEMEMANARPFGVSDRVKYQGKVGVVEHIVRGGRSTQLSLRFEDGNTYVVDEDAVEFVNASGCGLCGDKGHVYDVDGDKKILCEKHAKEAGGVLLSNADNKIMVHCDQCNKTFYEEPDGDGLCPDCKSKQRKNTDEKLAREIREAKAWMERRKFKDWKEAAEEAVREADFSREAADAAAKDMF